MTSLVKSDLRFLNRRPVKETQEFWDYSGQLPGRPQIYGAYSQDPDNRIGYDLTQGLSHDLEETRLAAGRR